MKLLFLLPLIVFSRGHKSAFNSFSVIPEDTSIVIHQLDGNTAEWPKEKFKTDNETKMSYAVDNDNQTLFLAIIISDKTIQKKVLQNGMNLYIDIKGKKKENNGIEFPVKIEDVSSVEKMKLFGFGDGEPVLQNLRAEGSANIAIAWDSDLVIHLEYNIPLKMLAETLTDLNDRKISIGWKLKEDAMPASNNPTVRTTSRIVAVPAGSRPALDRNVGSNNNYNTLPQPNTNKAQSIWTTHTIIF